MAEVRTQSNRPLSSSDREPASSSSELARLRKELLQRIVKNEARRMTASNS